ncbi:MAG: DUF697 domain-containing protein [Pararhodobacter sp.]|nr:DUF697 domain-containing protein [Pararhodobacter sp.]
MRPPENNARGPVLIDLGDGTPPPDVASAPPVDADEPPLQGRAMQGALASVARPPGWTGRLILLGGGGVLTLALGLAAWDFAATLLARVPALGWLAVVLLAALGLGLIVLAGREWMGWRRLRRLDGLRAQAEAARSGQDAAAARDVARALARLHAGTGQAAPHPDPLDEIDAEAILDAAEMRWLLLADTRARAEIELAARQVAMITALVPLALADVLAALTINLRMIRRIAEIYGGRAGVLGGWRLARAVVLHLTATGMVAVGDDLLGSVAGGGMVSKLSRRFGEGVVNGALTARVGLSAMDICRPLPFRMAARPGLHALMGRALSGVFQRG